MKRVVVVATGGVLIAAAVAATELPRFVGTLENQQDFRLFATSGWDGNWYVGWGHGWVVQLPPVPETSSYARAYVGACLGRAKLEDEYVEVEVSTTGGRKVKERRPTGRKIPIPGRILAAVGEARTELARTEEIPAEGDPAVPVETAGEARWFWAEVPLSSVRGDGPTLLRLWSEDQRLNGPASAPILAAGLQRSFEEMKSVPAYHVTESTSGKTVAWLDEKTTGQPPSPLTQITFYRPALALKLVPEGAAAVDVWLEALPEDRNLRPEEHPVLTARIQGEGVEAVWLEVDEAGWKRHGRVLTGPPYQFTVRPTLISPGEKRIRVAARDIWGTVGHSPESWFTFPRKPGGTGGNAP